MTLLKVSNVSMTGEDNFTLKNISFAQRKLQRIVIAGENGSGKSTLLKLIAGLAQPDSGEMSFDGKKVLGPADKLVPGNDQIAYLSQHFELQKFLRVEQILSYSNTLSEADATKLYQVCQIDHLLKRRSDALSGGERQRIGLARLLISSPKLLLLDEPFSNLDMVHKNVLKAVIDDIIKTYKVNCILVSHEPADSLSWADRIIVLKDGHLVQQGTPEKIYHSPANEYVAGLFGKYQKLTPSLWQAFNGRKAKMNSKNIFARPEYFKIVPKSTKAVAGKVLGVSFFGCYYELSVEVNKEVVSILSTQGDYKVGKKVFVGYSVRQ